MPTLKTLEISNYRSIRGPLHLTVPTAGPLVLIGENNAGKSNIVRAFDMVLGQAWTGTHDPDDHEFFGRDRSAEIEIRATFAHEDLLADQYAEARWTFNVERAGAAAHSVGPSRYEHRRYDYMSNDIKSSCICVVIEADRNLNYHLSYATKWTFLSRLMHSFHKALTDDNETKKQLEELFGEVKERFERVQPYAQFVDTLQEQLEGFAGTMTHRLEVDFQAYNPINFFHALRLHAVEGTTPRTLAELGTGEQQILALSFAYAYAIAFHRGILLIVEEPEAHLHPLAQQWLARHMHSLALGGLQIVLTTHSPHFIDVENLEGLAYVRRSDAGTQVVQLDRQQLVDHCLRTGAPRERVTPDGILPYYAANMTPQILEGFFAKVVVLVEGPTETLSFPVYLEACGLVPSKEGIAVVPVGGKGNLAKWRRLFSAFGVPTYVVFDNDGRQDDRHGAKRRDALRALGIAEDQETEYLMAEGWRVWPEVMVFGRNFEEEMRVSFPRYRELEEAATASGVDAKPFVAKWVAGHMPEGENLGWLRLREFAAAIRALIPSGPRMAAAPGAEVDGHGALGIRRSAARRNE